MSSRPARPARQGPPPAALEEESRRADIRWCLDCGAAQSGAVRCQACGGYRTWQLGFSDLYKAYAGPLRRFVRRLAVDGRIPESLVDTDGVVHDTFTALLSGSREPTGSREPIRNPVAWLFTVARNKVKKAAAAQRRIAPGDPADLLDGGRAAWSSLAPPAADPEDIRAAREVMRAIAGLHGHQKIATYLRQVEGWTLAEVGAYLDCAASTAGVHISRGTRKVRVSLSGSASASSGSASADDGSYYLRHADHGHHDSGHADHGSYADLRGSQGVQIGNGNAQANNYHARPASRRSMSPSYPRRRRAWRRVLAAAGTLAGALLAPAGAHALGMPWWLAVVAAAVLIIAARVGRPLLRAGIDWLRAGADWLWTEVDWLWAGIGARRRQRRFNRWLRTGRPLGPARRARRP